ncbi:MAG: amidohydrolase family protein [Bacteroidia bacterium]|nr:amidohydrolase family protein [Bacteroidia bacterium]
MKIIAGLSFMLLLVACTGQNQFYKTEDFEKVKKIDSHLHIWGERDLYVQCAIKDNFKLIPILVGGSKGQQKNAVSQKERHPEDVEFVGSFSMDGWDEPDWVNRTIAWIDTVINEGAVAIKIWKNIGMEFRDKDGKYVMADDPKFDSIFKMLADRKIPVIGHLGEPRDCWLPLDQMKAMGNRTYYTKNPQYHMFLHPEMPSYKDQISAMEGLLERNPDLIYIGAHLASLEWDVDEIAKRLDRFPNMAVDVSARLPHIFYQTSIDREKVKNFFMKYQNRILYGTDIGDRGGDEETFRKTIHTRWVNDWKYFVTDEILTSDQIDREFQGIKLPRKVVDKIYNLNARKWLGVFK